MTFLTARHPAPWGLLLLLLTVPAFPWLQTHVGPPARLVLSVLAVPLLHLSGIEVVRDGMALHWDDRVFLVAEPCSGVRKLWAGLLLTLILSCLYRLSAARTWAALAVGLLAVTAGNALRIAALFHLEVVLRYPSKWLHDGTGAVAFALSAALIVAAVRALTRT